MFIANMSHTVSDTVMHTACTCTPPMRREISVVVFGRQRPTNRWLILMQTFNSFIHQHPSHTIPSKFSVEKHSPVRFCCRYCALRITVSPTRSMLKFSWDVDVVRCSFCNSIIITNNLFQHKSTMSPYTHTHTPQPPSHPSNIKVK